MSAGSVASLASEPRPATTRPATGTYRPHLDGLRAVAVYLVVLFHAGVGSFSGGYIGVDVFFVLSGFLVTQLLLRDVVRQGGIRFARFYARRYRRLLPAAFVTLIVTACVYAALASPGNALESVNAFKAAFLYVSNWFFIHRSTAYFGGDIAENPVLQFWSLAIEEQFYLVWPLVLVGLLACTRRLGTRQTRALQVVVGTAAVLSLSWALYLRTSDPTRAYFGTDARAYQLLAGALIALTPGLVQRVARTGRGSQLLAPASLVAVVLLAGSWLHLDAIQRGALATVATVVLIIALEADRGSPAQQLLSSDPVVYLGRISYGTYLWHWPVILVMTELLHLSTISTLLLTLLLATSLASLSHQLLERPIRESKFLDAHKFAVIAAGLAISIIAALVFIPAILEPSTSSANSVKGNTTTDLTPVPAGLDFAGAVFSALPRTPKCVNRAPSACTVVEGSRGHILLMGDSHARMFLPTLTAIARKDDLKLSVVSTGGCLWQRHVYTPLSFDECRELKEDAYKRVIPALHPDAIVAVNYGYDGPQFPPFPVEGEDARETVRGKPEFNKLMLRATNQSVKELLGRTRNLVLIEPVPFSGEVDPTACLKRSEFLEPCRFVAPTRLTPLVRQYRTLAKGSDRVWSANLNRLACPFFPICDPVVAGHIVRVDRDHFSVDYATYIADQLDEYLRANRIIDPSR